VTGVQTCALPIFQGHRPLEFTLYDATIVLVLIPFTQLVMYIMNLEIKQTNAYNPNTEELSKNSNKISLAY
jgi:hypothetical protein